MQGHRHLPADAQRRRGKRGEGRGDLVDGDDRALFPSSASAQAAPGVGATATRAPILSRRIAAETWLTRFWIPQDIVVQASSLLSSEAGWKPAPQWALSEGAGEFSFCGTGVSPVQMEEEHGRDARATFIAKSRSLPVMSRKIAGASCSSESFSGSTPILHATMGLKRMSQRPSASIARRSRCGSWSACSTSAPGPVPV